MNEQSHRGRPQKPQISYQVHKGTFQFDILLSDYFSDFGINDGLVIEKQKIDLEEERYEAKQRKLIVQRVFQRQKNNFVDVISNLEQYRNLSDADFILYLQEITKIVSLMFCEQYCGLILSAFSCIGKTDQEKQKIRNTCFQASEYFSFSKLGELERQNNFMKTKKTKMIYKKQKMSPEDLAVIQKLEKNFRNKRKRDRKNNANLMQNEDQKEHFNDKNKIHEQFAKMFSQLTILLQNFKNLGQFIKQKKIRDECYSKIMRSKIKYE